MVIIITRRTVRPDDAHAGDDGEERGVQPRGHPLCFQEARHDQGGSRRTHDSREGRRDEKTKAKHK